MLPKQAWWGVVSNYNTAIFPTQLIVMAIGVIIIGYFIAKQSIIASILLKSYFSFCNLWIGIVFFLILGKDLGAPLNIIQGSAFIAIGALMSIDIFNNRTQFIIPKDKRSRRMMYGMLALITVYSTVGLCFGRGYDKLIYFGTLPCATTALLLIFMQFALPKANKATYILLLIWAIPFAPLIQIPKYHVYEDGIMFVIGVVSLVKLVKFSLKSKK